MAIQRSNPSNLADPGGYSHVVRDGNIVWIAGQVARDANGNTVGVGDAEAQMEQVFQNLQVALASVGCDFTNVVKVNTFMTHREDIPAYRTVRPKYINSDLPVSTLIMCSGLAEPEFRVEIECTAVVPS
jgi:enamine deaminase RidA (YjgF/YER057c/UK114 family)